MNVLVAIGSRKDQICSVGSFARAEARALEKVFGHVEILEPDAAFVYPKLPAAKKPDLILFHAPALHDRGKPWRLFLSAGKLKAAYPRALFVPIVHEYSEAPNHWRVRQGMLAALASGVIVNSEADYNGVRPWTSKILRTHLGPTLFYEELLEPAAFETKVRQISALRSKVRAKIVESHGKSHGLGENEKWVLHPGLLTPGKGINFLGKLTPHLPPDSRLIIMGGMGPKEEDRKFAEKTLAELRQNMSGRFSFVEGPDDETFRSFLLASDLIVLPYDNGLSERRSSFLSAMCCGANVWTTTGRFTSSLSVERSGVHLVSVEEWASGDERALRSVAQALNQSEEKIYKRRVRNLEWAANRSWQKRAEKVAAFVTSLK